MKKVNQQIRGKEELVLMQELPIPEATEDKIQAAYDIVRARSRQKTEGGKVRPIRKRPLRRAWAAGLAAALIAVSGFGVMAAAGYFSKTVNQEGNNLSYAFEVNYDLKPVEVKAVPGYLPEGMKEFEEGSGKYWTEENYGHGITLIPISVFNIEEQKRIMDFSHVDQVEKTTIQGMEAHIITYQEAEKYEWGKDILLFNPEQGYVLRVYGDFIVPIEEMKQVAENLQITVTEGSMEYADLEKGDNAEMRAAQEAADEEFWRLADKGVTADQIAKVGESLKVFDGNEVTVNKVQVYDSLYDIPGYTEDGAYDLEELKPWLNADGTHKPYQRICTNYETGEEMEERTEVKFLMVEATMKQNAEFGPDEDTALDACLVRVEKRADGTWNRIKDDYLPVPSEHYRLQVDGRCFFISVPEHLEGVKRAKSFFYRHLDLDESITYTMIFAVDADLVKDGQIKDAVLCFNATGNSPIDPQFSALGALE